MSNILYYFSNFNIINMNNLFNFHISILKTLDDYQALTYIENMKIHFGITNFEYFKTYIFKKLPGDKILSYIK